MVEHQSQARKTIVDVIFFSFGPFVLFSLLNVFFSLRPRNFFDQ